MLRDYLTVGVSIVGAEPVNPGQLGPTGIVIGPLPAMSMPGQFAGATPTMANFQYLLGQLQAIVASIPTNITSGAITEYFVTNIYNNTSLDGLTFATIASEPLLTGSRKLTAGTNVTFLDNGAGKDLIISATGGAASGGGFLKTDEWTIAGTYTWICPPSVTGGWFTGSAGGGSGSASIVSTIGGGSGGAGEYCNFQTVRQLIPGHSYTVIVGPGGAALAAGLVVTTKGNDGGDTSFDQFFLRGGKGGAASTVGGIGGGLKGGAGGAIAGGIGVLGTAEGPCHFGGTGGSSGGNAGGTNGGVGQGGPGFLAGGLGGTAGGGQAGGGGGPATPWGIGGKGGVGGLAGSDAPAGSYGAPGGGAGGHATTTVASGAGMDGFAAITYIA